MKGHYNLYGAFSSSKEEILFSTLETFPPELAKPWRMLASRVDNSIPPFPCGPVLCTSQLPPLARGRGLWV